MLNIGFFRISLYFVGPESGDLPLYKYFLYKILFYICNLYMQHCGLYPIVLSDFYLITNIRF